MTESPLPRRDTPVDRLISAADQALRTVFARHRSARPHPDGALTAQDEALEPSQRALSVALMRVNHVGEVCAQALYTAQALSTRDPELAEHFERAAAEETDHLAWCERRLDELGGRPSLLNPLWYAGAFGIGLVAGRLGGDPVSLGFVVETERQVEQHLMGHLDRLPAADAASRAIVEQMARDEIEHGDAAQARGARPLPAPVRGLMRLAARVMTTTAHRI